VGTNSPGWPPPSTAWPGDWLVAEKHYRTALAFDAGYRPALANLERVVRGLDRRGDDLTLGESVPPSHDRPADEEQT
jgi:hypothetical protein